MKRDLVRIEPLTSSFLSCEKDTETILKKLFINSRPYSEYLKRLLVINTPDCLDENNIVYKKTIDEMSLSTMIQLGYIETNPQIKFTEHEEIKSSINISFDNFVPNKSNPKFRDCNVIFNIVCNYDQWEIGNYQQRPYKIAGYIDGLLNETKLSGIGTLNFLGAGKLVLDEHWGGITLIYKAIHGSDDQIPPSEE